MQAPKDWSRRALLASAVLGVGFSQSAGAAGIFLDTGALSSARLNHTATLLPTGRVLVAGGESLLSGVLASAEVYDQTTGTFSGTGAMATARTEATAALLPNGLVLIAGGTDRFSPLASAELYDAENGSFASTGSLVTGRSGAMATLLADGRLLIAGGIGSGAPLASAELYDPRTGHFTSTGNLVIARTAACATLLPDGKVLIAGGYKQPNVGLASAEVYDPSTGSFALVGSMTAGRIYATATLLPNNGIPGRENKVLLVGGTNGSSYLASAELYNPATQTFAATGSLDTPRAYATAALLPDDSVVVVGGLNSTGGFLNTGERYDPARRLFSPIEYVGTPQTLHVARASASSTLLPNGRLLIVGGTNTYAIDSAEIFDESDGSSSDGVGRVVPTGSMLHARDSATATLLPDGRVLVAGGFDDGGALASAELFDPATGGFSSTGALHAARFGAKATLLLSGEVLLAGGSSQAGDLASAELYDPGTGTFTVTGSMAAPRINTTSTLLPDGKVLIAGGYGNGVCRASAEIYDPESRSFSPTGSLAHCRSQHTATLLTSGRVLVAGGDDTGTPLQSAELYNPATGLFSAAGSMRVARAGATATLLPDGRVLLEGGRLDAPGFNPEVYNPDTGAFEGAAANHVPRFSNAVAVLDAAGRAQVLGGTTPTTLGYLLEFYIPDRDTFGAVVLLEARRNTTVTRLLDGQLLIAGGYNGSTYLASALLYDPSVGHPAMRLPVLDAPAADVFAPPAVLRLTGRGFRGSSQHAAGAIAGSESSGGGTNSSATNFPLIQLERLDNEQQFYVGTDPSTLWTDTSVTARSLAGLPFGHYRVTVIVNGVPGVGRIIDLRLADSTPPPACAEDANTVCLAQGRFRVRVDWRTTAASGKAQVMSFGSHRAGTEESVFYWFFSPSTFEMGLKVLDACGLNGKFWVFISGLTNQGWTVHVLDTQTGATRTYSNSVGHLTATTADTAAFSCN